MRTSRWSRSHYPHAELAKPVDPAHHQIAPPHGADPFGRAREDEVARLQLEELRQVGYRLRRRPDELGDVGTLLLDTVDLEPDRAVIDMADLVDGMDRAERRRIIESL